MRCTISLPHPSTAARAVEPAALSRQRAPDPDRLPRHQDAYLAIRTDDQLEQSLRSLPVAPVGGSWLGRLLVSFEALLPCASPHTSARRDARRRDAALRRRHRGSRHAACRPRPRRSSLAGSGSIRGNRGRRLPATEPAPPLVRARPPLSLAALAAAPAALRLGIARCLCPSPRRHLRGEARDLRPSRARDRGGDRP